MLILQSPQKLLTAPFLLSSICYPRLWCVEFVEATQTSPPPNWRPGTLAMTSHPLLLTRTLPHQCCIQGQQDNLFMMGFFELM